VVKKKLWENPNWLWAKSSDWQFALYQPKQIEKVLPNETDQKIYLALRERVWRGEADKLQKYKNKGKILTKKLAIGEKLFMEGYLASAFKIEEIAKELNLKAFTIQNKLNNMECKGIVKSFAMANVGRVAVLGTWKVFLTPSEELKMVEKYYTKETMRRNAIKSIKKRLEQYDDIKTEVVHLNERFTENELNGYLNNVKDFIKKQYFPKVNVLSKATMHKTKNSIISIAYSRSRPKKDAINHNTINPLKSITCKPLLQLKNNNKQIIEKERNTSFRSITSFYATSGNKESNKQETEELDPRDCTFEERPYPSTKYYDKQIASLNRERVYCKEFNSTLENLKTSFPVYSLKEVNVAFSKNDTFQKEKPLLSSDTLLPSESLPVLKVTRPQRKVTHEQALAIRSRYSDPVDNSSVYDIVSAYKTVIHRKTSQYLDITPEGKHKKYFKHFQGLRDFLVKERGENRKMLLQMGIDYFNILRDYYRKNLGLKGFPLSHVNTEKGKKLYREYLRTMGTTYFDLGIDLEAENAGYGHFAPTEKERDSRYIPEPPPPPPISAEKLEEDSEYLMRLALGTYYEKLKQKSEDLDPEIAKIVNTNFSKLV
jgi:hypothetical protein